MNPVIDLLLHAVLNGLVLLTYFILYMFFIWILGACIGFTKKGDDW